MRLTSSPRVRTYDAVIVGSGATGGWAALELTRSGLDVAVLEAGPMLSSAQMFDPYLPEHLQPYRGLDRAWIDRTFYVDKTEHPYTTPDDRPFNWTRSRHVGGKSLTWSRGTPRMTEFDFDSPALHGYGIPWPIRNADLKPYYDEVEDFIGVCGINEGNPAVLPDAVLLPPQSYTPIEWQLKKSNESRLGRVTTMIRSATLTRDHLGRKGLYSAPAVSGRQPEAFFSSVVSTLPAATRTGRMHLRQDTIVSHLTVDPSDPTRPRGVWCVDRQRPGEHFEIQGRMIFLCASALESTRILLNSVSRHHPNGFANSSETLGRYLMDHHNLVSVRGVFEDFDPANDGPWLSTRSTANAWVPRFQNLGRTPDRPYLGGFHAQMWSVVSETDDAVGFDGFGVELKRRKQAVKRTWLGGFNGHGEMLPRWDNHCRLDGNLKDRWGIPALHIDCAFTDNERAMAQDMAASYQEMIELAGAKQVSVRSRGTIPGDAIHECGTARMGSDPRNSYLNAFNQSHSAPNLFVTDGACLTSSANQNPTLTLMALTLRATRYAVRELRAGRI